MGFNVFQWVFSFRLQHFRTTAILLEQINVVMQGTTVLEKYTSIFVLSYQSRAPVASERQDVCQALKAPHEIKPDFLLLQHNSLQDLSPCQEVWRNIATQRPQLVF